jgi:hypothetical protein
MSSKPWVKSLSKQLWVRYQKELVALHGAKSKPLSQLVAWLGCRSHQMAPLHRKMRPNPSIEGMPKRLRL